MNTRSAAPTPPPEPAKAEAQGSLAATCIRALLDRAGLPRHRHSAHIGGLLSRERAGVRTLHLAEILASTEALPWAANGTAEAGAPHTGLVVRG